MKKALAAFAVLLALSGKAFAENIAGDLINFVNYTATFTKIIDVNTMSNFSIEVVFSTSPQASGISAGNTAIDVVNDTIYSTVTWGQGQQVLLATTSASNTMPTGLIWGTTYFVIPISDAYFKLSLTSTGAVAGLGVDITATSTSTLAFVTPLTLSIGAAGLTWDGSNDGTNFATVGSSCTLTTVGTGIQLRDFGAYAYKFLRLTFSGVTAGSMKLRAFINGRRG